MSILDDLHLIDDPHERELRSAINRACAGAYLGHGEPITVELTDGTSVIGYGMTHPSGLIEIAYTIIPNGVDS